MKKNILLLFSLFFTLSLVAQDLTISNTEIQSEQADETVFLFDTPTAYVTNNTSETRSYTWTRTNVSKPDAWDVSVCDVDVCSLPHVNSKSFTLEAGAEGLLKLQIRPNETAGSAEVHMEVTDDNNPNSSVEVTFYIQIGDASSGDLTITETEVYYNESDETIFLFDTPATYVTNNTSETRSYTWTRTNVSKPDAWDVSVCDVDVCSLPHVNSKSFTLEAGAEGLLKLQVRPNETAGSAEVHMEVTDDNDPDSSVEVTFYMNVGPVSTEDVELQTIQMFPNPAHHTLNIFDSKKAISEVAIFNVVGRAVKNFAAAPNGQYDISDLTTGLYLVQLQDAKGNIIRTMRLHKN